ncbi:MAG: type II CAAX endopeptidase family protein [Pseudomonadota bacterium]
MRDPYAAFEALVAPARPSATLPRLIIGTVLTVVLFFSLIYCVSALLTVLSSAETLQRYDTALATGNTPLGVLANLYVFALVIIALAITLKQVHGRTLQSVIGDLNRARTQFLRVIWFLVILHLVLMVLLPGNPRAEPEPNMDLSRWLVFLPLALPAILIQTSAEELAFRGYLQSQLAARFAHPVIWLTVPAILFGLLHYDTITQGDNAGVVLLWATAFGLASADITARAGTLGPAIALHFMNNGAAILVAAPTGNFDGLALYTYPFSLDDAGSLWIWAPVDLMVLFISWLVTRLALRC